MLAILPTDPTVLFYITLALATLSVAGIGVVLFQAFRGTTQDAVKHRFQRIKGSGIATRETDEKWEKTLRSLSRLTAPKEQREVKTLQRTLSYAGYRNPNAPIYFFGIKTITVLALGGAVVLYSVANTLGLFHDLMAVGVFTLLGLYAPNLWIRMKTNRRNDALNRALPNALDLLVVCAESGLGLDMALKRVGGEIAPTAPELAKELSLVSLELNSGIPRQRALTNLGERNNLDELKSLATILVQADKFGTSITQALRVSADSIRTKRRQTAEEKAAKTTVKLAFPLVFFILPATFIIVIGPALITLVNTVLPTLTK
ncbi:MAG: type II secretion system F family protein [Dehalococcoidia bacterium]